MDVDVRKGTPELIAGPEKELEAVLRITIMRGMQNRSIPRVTVIPELPYANVGEAIEWLSAAFGFRLRLRIGDHRAQMHVGNDGAMVITEMRGTACSCSVLVRVEDVDAHYAIARDRGARIVRAPEDHVYGERQYTARDIGGHVWTFSQSIEDVDPTSWGGTAVAL